MDVRGPVPEVPRWENRVEIDPSVKDYCGIPTLRISGRKPPSDLKTAKFMAAKAAEWLRSVGALEVFQQLPGMGVSGGQHQAGTARKSKDHKLGGVDEDCRVFGVENLYVADGSVHVTNGGFNPSLTLQSLAYRTSAKILASSHIAKRV